MDIPFLRVSRDALQCGKDSMYHCITAIGGKKFGLTIILGEGWFRISEYLEIYPVKIQNTREQCLVQLRYIFPSLVPGSLNKIPNY